MRYKLRSSDIDNPVYELTHHHSIFFKLNLPIKMTFLFLFFLSADEIIVKMHGSQLTQRYLEKHGFDVPIMVPKLDDLGLRLPPPTFSVMDVERYVGTNFISLSTWENVVKVKMIVLVILKVK